jgi:hypothetical protein
MACPICGATCRCRKRGEGGICCSCHKHTARARQLGISLDVFRNAHEKREPIASDSACPDSVDTGSNGV